MSAYLGPAGGLVPFLCPSAVGISTDRAMSYWTTLVGRVKVQRGPAARRQWSVDIGSATPGELANLQALEQTGTPPWIWVEPYAQVTNLLTPDQSTLAPGTWSSSTGATQGGPVTVDGVVVPRSVVAVNGGNIDAGFNARPPVVRGVPVSASAYVRGVGSLVLQWRDWNDASLGSFTQAFDHDVMTQVKIDGRNPPVGAVTARLLINGLRQAAMPAVTWTTTAPDWAMGRGCTKAVVEGLSESVQHAVRDHDHLRLSGLSFTVREVG